MLIRDLKEVANVFCKGSDSILGFADQMVFYATTQVLQHKSSCRQ